MVYNLLILVAAETSTLDGGFIIGLLGALAAIGSMIALFIKSRGDNKTSEKNAKTALDARIDARVESQLTDAWDRIKSLETDVKALQTNQSRRDGAITRILRSIAKQWPNAEGPDLDPNDISIIEETVPAQWIRPKPT